MNITSKFFFPKLPSSICKVLDCKDSDLNVYKWRWALITDSGTDDIGARASIYESYRLNLTQLAIVYDEISKEHVNDAGYDLSELKSNYFGIIVHQSLLHDPVVVKIIELIGCDIIVITPKFSSETIAVEQKIYGECSEISSPRDLFWSIHTFYSNHPPRQTVLPDLHRLYDSSSEAFALGSSDFSVSLRGKSLKYSTFTRKWDVLVGRFESILSNLEVGGLICLKKRLRDRSLLRNLPLLEATFDCEYSFEHLSPKLNRAKYIIETFLPDLETVRLKLEDGETTYVVDYLTKVISKCNQSSQLAWLKSWFVALQDVVYVYHSVFPSFEISEVPKSMIDNITSGGGVGNEDNPASEKFLKSRLLGLILEMTDAVEVVVWELSCPLDS